MTGKRALITGVTGQDGVYLAQLLLQPAKTRAAFGWEASTSLEALITRLSAKA